MPKIELGFDKKIDWTPVNETLPKTIDKAIDFAAMTEEQKKVFSSSYNGKIALGYLLLIIPGIVMSNKRKKMWKEFISQTKLDWEQLVSQSFNSFENVKISGKASVSQVSLGAIKTIRPSGLDADMILFNVTTLLDGIIDSLRFSTFFVTYRATRQRRVGETWVTYYVYDHRVVVVSNDINSSFKDFQFAMAPDGIFTKNAKLENDKFNKLFTVQHNDEIKLRKLLTPSVQENLVLAAQKARDINLHIANGVMVLNLNIATNMGENLNTIAAAKPRPEKELEGLIQNHIVRDLQNIATALSIANIFRNIQEIFK